MKDSTARGARRSSDAGSDISLQRRVSFNLRFRDEWRGMRATQRVAEVTWTGSGGERGVGWKEDISKRGRSFERENGEELFFVFYQKRRPFFKPGSVRAAVAAGIVVHRSRQ